ncbi:hypothetical protein [Flavobacterium sp. 3HN19-14]|uniref:hypothetical protein n=1 Tax=Flavobacterium sp. 3HN19-14 TaxID=3448133 RepID=UPI003EDEBBAE
MSVTGYQKMAFANQVIEIEPNENGRVSLLVKFDTNKNVIWTRKFGTVGNVDFISICLDGNENPLITGMAGTVFHSLYLNPEPADPNFPENLTPTQTNITDDQEYGFLLRMDSEGHYIDSRLFRRTELFVEADHADNIIVSGNSYDLNEDHFQLPYAFIKKFDADLNPLWETSYAQIHKSRFWRPAFDSLNNIYLQGSYHTDFSFANNLIVNPDPTHGVPFIAKIMADGTQQWIMNLPWQTFYGQTTIKVDASDHIYFIARFGDGQSFAFQNETVTLDPGEFSSGTVFFKMDTNRNHIWAFQYWGLKQTSGILTLTVTEKSFFLSVQIAEVKYSSEIKILPLTLMIQEAF